MVAMKLATLAILATVAVAAPTTAATPNTTEVKPFSFSQWVDDIINPDVVALTPEEAVEAYYQSINATSAAKVSKRFSRYCYEGNNDDLRADVNLAAKCVSSLAALRTDVRYNVLYWGDLVLCRDIPGTKMEAATATGRTYTATAHDFAVAGGYIMDGCTWGGKTGGAIYEDFNPVIEIHLSK